MTTITKYVLVDNTQATPETVAAMDKGLKFALGALGAPYRPIFGDSPADIIDQNKACGMPDDHSYRIVEVTFRDLPTTGTN